MLRFVQPSESAHRFPRMRVTPDQIIRDEIRAVGAYHVPDSRGYVKLDAMENPYGLPAELAEELGRLAAEAPLNRYPDPSAAALKARLREVMGVPAGMELLLGNGSDEIILMLALAVNRPGAMLLAPGAVVRHVPHGRELRGPALRGRAACAGLRPRPAAPWRARSARIAPR